MTTTSGDASTGTQSRVSTVDFPSPDWFWRLGEIMTYQRAKFEQLGYVDCVMGVTIIDGAVGDQPWHVLVRFEEYDLAEVREVGDDEITAADFILETDLGTWQEMVDSICAGAGEPDLEHTLNYLCLPGTPIRLWSEDSLQRDAFYRFNQSLQRFVDNCSDFTTTFRLRG